MSQTHVRNDRGATVVEYALVIALVAVFCIGAIQSLQERSEDKLDEGAASRGLPVETANIPANGGNIVGGGTGSSVGTGAASVHVFEMTGTATSDPGTNWAATVTVKVKNVATPDLWAGVTVTGHWRFDELNGSGNAVTAARDITATCTTTDDGLCTMTISNLKKSGNGQVQSVVFDTVSLSGPSGSGIVYQPQPGDPTAVGPLLRP